MTTEQHADPISVSPLSVRTLRKALEDSAYVIIAPDGIPEMLELIEFGELTRRTIREAVRNASNADTR